MRREHDPCPWCGGTTWAIDSTPPQRCPMCAGTGKVPRLSLVWYPTFRCPLKCAYCASRTMPVVSHGRERRAEEWAAAFAGCPLKIDQIAVTGGEPSAFAGLAVALGAVDAGICIDTNLRFDPAKWLPEGLWHKVRAVNAGLQFHPDHEEAACYWERLTWLKERLPKTQVVCAHVVLWRDLPGAVDIAKRKAEEIGAEYRPICFDDSYLWREKFPAKPGRREQCGAGYDFGVLLPDGAIFRCIGHAYYGVGRLGNVFNDGFGALLRQPEACETLLCTVCDQTEKTGVDEEPDGGFV